MGQRNGPRSQLNGAVRRAREPQGLNQRVTRLLEGNGAGEGDRTLDNSVGNAALYH